MSKRFVAVVLMLMMVFTLAACNSQPTTPNQGSTTPAAPVKPDKKNPKGELRFGLVGDPAMFNTILSTDTTSSGIYAFVYEGLYSRNEKLEWYPVLAKEMPKVSADGLIWNIKLREGVKWTDGKPFTAKDVKYLYDAMMHPDYTGPRRSAVSTLEKVDIVNDTEVKFTLKEPFAPFMVTLSYGVMPSHILEKTSIKDMRTNELSQKPIGTGPYTFGEWQKGQYIILNANPDYWGEGPLTKSVRFKTYQDTSVMLAGLEANEIDTATIPPDDVERVKKERVSLLDFYQFENNGYEYFDFNLHNPIFQDIKVRQALSYALNKDQIIKDVMKGFAKPVNSLYPPSSWAYSEKAVKYDYNLEKAKQLLDEAGWKMGADGFRYKDGKKLEFTVSLPDGNKIRLDRTLIAQNSWKAIGVDIKVETMEWSALLKSRFDVGKYDMGAQGWSLGADPDAYSIWHSSQSQIGADGFVKGLNSNFYNSPEADKLIEDGRRETDQAKRKEIYGKLSELISKDAPYIFLYQSLNNVGLNKRVKDTTRSPFGFIRWEKAWVDESFKPAK